MHSPLREEIEWLMRQIEDCRAFYAKLLSIREISHNPHAYDTVLEGEERIANNYKQELKDILNGQKI